VGAVAGGLAGKDAAEEVNPTVEDAYWRGHYNNRPYVKSGASYDTYQAAYRYGWESRSRHAGKKFDELEGDLERDWTTQRGDSSLNWPDARGAVRDAWHRDRRQSMCVLVRSASHSLDRFDERVYFDGFHDMLHETSFLAQLYVRLHSVATQSNAR
jgi:hypothetical protein